MDFLLFSPSAYELAVPVFRKFTMKTERLPSWMSVPICGLRPPVLFSPFATLVPKCRLIWHVFPLHGCPPPPHRSRRYPTPNDPPPRFSPPPLLLYPFFFPDTPVSLASFTCFLKLFYHDPIGPLSSVRSPLSPPPPPLVVSDVLSILFVCGAEIRSFRQDLRMVRG